MRLENELIYLRPMTEEDTNLIVNWRNKDFVRKNFIYREDFTPEGHLNWIRTMIDTGKAVQYIIVEKAKNQPIGSVYLRDIDYEKKEAEFGIFIGEKEALGRGFGTSAVKLMSKAAGDELGLERLFLRLIEDNQQAFKAYSAAGYRQLEDVSDIKNGEKIIFMETML